MTVTIGIPERCPRKWTQADFNRRKRDRVNAKIAKELGLPWPPNQPGEGER